MYLPLTILLQATACTALLVPPPIGPYGVYIETKQLTDRSRKDPYAPHDEHRSLMVSAFFPSCKAEHCKVEKTPYMPPTTADFINTQYASLGVDLPKGTLQSIELSLCHPKTSYHSIVDDSPLLLFSPGLGASRLIYSVIAQSIASHGYIVVTVDHPYDAAIVEYPDGTTVHGANITTEPEIIADVNVRAADLSSVLDHIEKQRGSRWRNSQKLVRSGKVGVFGHSLGGATAATAMANDTRFAGGMNFDGAFWGDVISTGVKAPFIAFGSDREDVNDSWKKIWPHLDWKLQLKLLGSAHGTFSDFSYLAELLFGNPLPEPAVPILGSIKGTRALEIITSYTVAFFDMVLKCESPALLQRENATYPEVKFVEQ